MKIVGMLFIIASAIVFSFERAVAEERRLKALEEIYRFILRLGVDIGCYLKPISDIADDFSSQLLSSLGFFEEIKRSGVYSAYLTLDSQIRFSDEAKRVLDGFFSMLGNGYADTIKDFQNRTMDECHEMGLNESMIHVDFMIGCDTMNIDAVCADGKVVPIFKNGNWAF